MSILVPKKSSWMDKEMLMAWSLWRVLRVCWWGDVGCFFSCKFLLCCFVLFFSWLPKWRADPTATTTAPKPGQWHGVFFVMRCDVMLCDVTINTFAFVIFAACKSWCSTNPREWLDKCEWRGMCDSCSACAGESLWSYCFAVNHCTYMLFNLYLIKMLCMHK